MTDSSDSEPVSENRLPADLSPQRKRELLKRLLQAKSQQARVFDMSSQQQGLWHAYRRDRSSTGFNVFLPSRIASRLNVDAMVRSIQQIVRRHACLRTTFSDQGGQLRQRVHESLDPEIVIKSAEGMSEEELRRQVLQQTQRPFDLEAGPLLRLAIFECSADDWIIVATTHHIVVDFWSLILILGEVSELYPSESNGVAIDLPPASNHYADFVAEQAEIVSGQGSNDLRKYWLTQMEDVPPVFEMPLDYRRPDQFTGRAGVRKLGFSLSSSRKIGEIAKRLGVTQTAVVLAMLQVLLHRYSRQDKFVIGSPVSGRRSRKYEQTVGFFVNMLPLCANLSGDPSFCEVVRRSSDTLIGALDHESYPFAQIVKEINPPRDTSRSPLFQVSCTFEKAQLKEQTGRAGFLFPGQSQSIKSAGLQQEGYPLDHPTCHYDLEFIFEQSTDRWTGMICYCADLFSSQSMKLLSDNFSALGDVLLLESGHALSLLRWPMDEKRGCISEIESNVTDLTVNQMFGSVVASSRDDTAIVEVDRQLTYEQLDQLAEQIADGLSGLGVRPGTLVPVWSAKGPAVVAVILGVMRCGGVVVPIDTDQPAVSLQQICRDGDVKVVIVDNPNRFADTTIVGAPIRGGLPVGWAHLPVPEKLTSKSDHRSANERHKVTPPSPTDLAYVIYTSGSTGQPKGVMIEHRSITNTLRWRKDTVKLSSDDRVIVLISHQFDAGFGLICAVLTQGAQLVWPDQPGQTDIDAIIEQLIRQQITVLAAPSSLLQVIVSHRRFEQCTSLRQIWTGGESMPAEIQVGIAAKSDAILWNFYGPTEAAVEATAYQVPRDHDERLVRVADGKVNQPCTKNCALTDDDASKTYQH